MKLNLKGIRNPADWPGYALPSYDIEAMAERTKKQPVWLHMGVGNIFRIFPAVLQQELIEAGHADYGIIACECYDEELITQSLTPHDNLSLAVTLKSDGTMDKRVVASIAETICTSTQQERLEEVFCSPSLQMITFTITEKGYAASSDNNRSNIMCTVADGLLARFKAGAPPIALVSLDNCSQNGTVLKNAIKSVAQEYPGFDEYLEKLSFPWTMIDKIVPRPSSDVAKVLQEDGLGDLEIRVTDKSIWISDTFVNGEECGYLVIEDSFPNGRPPLEKSGQMLQSQVFFTDRETVEKSEKMKVTTCLNPVHTALATAGCMLGYKSMSDVINDKRLFAFAQDMVHKESMPVVVDPKIIDPKEFLHDVLYVRLPNPFIKDTPQRIVEDNSQKISIRFGETIKARRKATFSDSEMNAIPLFFAIYARYLMGIDDKWQTMPVEQDPRREELMSYMTEPYNLPALFSDPELFGVDLYAKGGILAEKACGYFNELIQGPGAVDRTLNKYYGYICDCNNHES